MLNSGPLFRRTLSVRATVLFLVFACWSLWAQTGGGQARITAVECQSGDRIRVTVRFDRPVHYVEGTAVDPYRIFFDVQDTRPGGALAKIAVGDPVLQSIRVGQYQPGITRVVLDVAQPTAYSASLLSDPPRLVVEIARTGAVAQTHIVAPVAPKTATANLEIGQTKRTPAAAAVIAAPPVAAAPPVVSPAPIAAMAPVSNRQVSQAVPVPATVTTPPAATTQATASLARADSKLVSRFGGGASGEFSLLMKAAQRGDPNAQFNIGDWYMTGRDVERDPAVAAAWYKAAAQQGHAVAASNLGVLYAEGWGVKQSDADAVEWFRKAANAGDAGGENNLGSMYLAGRGVEASDAMGAKWIVAAAQQNSPEAQYALGTLYANGRGVAQDDAQAVKWLKAAAAQGYAPAQFLMGKLYMAGAGVPRSDADAVMWWQKAAGHGLAEAQSALGSMYLKRDPVEAYSWYALAAASGDKQAVAALNSIAPSLTAQQLVEAQQRARDVVKPQQ